MAESFNVPLSGKLRLMNTNTDAREYEHLQSERTN